MSFSIWTSCCTEKSHPLCLICQFLVGINFHYLRQIRAPHTSEVWIYPVRWNTVVWVSLIYKQKCMHWEQCENYNQTLSSSTSRKNYIRIRWSVENVYEHLSTIWFLCSKFLEEISLNKNSKVITKK